MLGIIIYANMHTPYIMVIVEERWGTNKVYLDQVCDGTISNSWASEVLIFLKTFLFQIFWSFCRIADNTPDLSWNLKKKFASKSNNLQRPFLILQVIAHTQCPDNCKSDIALGNRMVYIDSRYLDSRNLNIHFFFLISVVYTCSNEDQIPQCPCHFTAAT